MENIISNLIAAAKSQDEVGNFTAVPALLEQAEIIATEAGMHFLAGEIFNAYVEAKVKAWG